MIHPLLFTLMTPFFVLPCYPWFNSSTEKEVPKLYDIMGICLFILLYLPHVYLSPISLSLLTNHNCSFCPLPVFNFPFFCHSFSFGFLVLTYIPVQVNIYIYSIFFPLSLSLLNNWTSYPVGDGETYGNGWMIWLSYISCFYKVYLGNTHANDIWKRPALVFHI